jgi:hypothetical protein
VKSIIPTGGIPAFIEDRMIPQKLVLQTRRPSRDYSDPGAVEIGYWVVSGDSVHLCDENGAKTGTSRRLPEGTDPRNLAVVMLRDRVGRRNSSFNRPLHYPKLRY